jgi:hypothetical protein
LAVTPETEPATDTGPVAEHSKHRFRAVIDRPIGLDQVDGGAKGFDRYVLRKTLSDGLKRSDIDLFARGLLTSPDPADTKITIPVIDEKRFLRRSRAVRQAAWTTNLLQFLISSVAHFSHDSL